MALRLLVAALIAALTVMAFVASQAHLDKLFDEQKRIERIQNGH